MPRDLGDLTASLSRMPKAIIEGQERGVRKATAYTTGIIRDNIRSATGDMRLSGVGKKGARVGAKYKVSRVTGDDFSMEITATGPLHLVERRTDAHTIYPRSQLINKRTRRLRTGGRKALKIGTGFASWADHPGTTGKHPFEKGWRRAATQTTRIFDKELQASIARGWGIR